MFSRGIGIGMELLKPGAGWTCGRFDATQSRLVAVISGTQGEGGRAERLVIVTGYLRTKFLVARPHRRGTLHSGRWEPRFLLTYYFARPVSQLLGRERTGSFKGAVIKSCQSVKFNQRVAGSNPAGLTID